MIRKLAYTIATLLTVTTLAKSQDIAISKNYPLNGFRFPLEIPPVLAGSFGELRPNHFHSGIDFKTNQRQGYPVHAIGDGYVSRLRVQNSGFGLAVYITHPNGYTSVYGHLQRFNPRLAQKVKELQYKAQSYELDYYPKADELPLRKDDVIAYSGNSGSSGGPHLHFEIRDSKTEETINPQLFGLSVPDNTPPVIEAMYVYRLNGKTFNEFTPKQYFQVSGSNGHYSLNNVSTISLSNEVGFGLITHDTQTPGGNHNGVYSIELLLDEKPVFASALERFYFNHTKAINSHIDYAASLNTGRRIQKSFVDPGNPIAIYKYLVNNGRITFNDGQLHNLKYIVKDARGNTATLSFKVKSDLKAIINTPEKTQGQLFAWNKRNEFNTNKVKVIVPTGCLYNDMNLIYSTSAKPMGGFSEVHHIQNKLTPLHESFELWIKADSSLLAYKDKAVIISDHRASQGGVYENGYVKAQVRNFGNFYIAIDTVPPVINAINLSPDMQNKSKMIFRISDNLSGIKSFNGYLDGKWILMEFDTKTATLWHTFDERTTAGKHNFELVVTDMKGNTSKYKTNFNR